MKLVNADVLKDALFQKHVHDGEELEPMLYLDDAMKVVDEAPTIDAIPVEWLEQQFYDNPKSQWAEKCRDVYTKWQKWQRWQKEQEAR